VSGDPVKAFYLPVAGTWGYDGDPDPSEWWHPYSPWANFMAGRNIFHLDPDEPFVWDGAIDGLNWPWSTSRQKNLGWMAAATQLKRWLKTVPVCDRNIVAHSHGGQVALYCAMSLPINRLVTVSTPVRAEMDAVARAAVCNIAGGWWHLHGDWKDRWQIFGGLMDGACRIERRFLIPGVVNMGFPGIGHTDLLCNPDRFPLWEREGIVAFLRGELEL
jgi:pimeloyl-ACP methyl ester carboxylesterase